MIKYQLYLLPLSEETLSAVEDCEFKRINNRYVLAYVDVNMDKHFGNYHILEEYEISYLSESEKLWLMDCNLTIIARESMEKSEEIIQSFSEKLNRLEAELEKESRRIETDQ